MAEKKATSKEDADGNLSVNPPEGLLLNGSLHGVAESDSPLQANNLCLPSAINVHLEKDEGRSTGKQEEALQLDMPAVLLAIQPNGNSSDQWKRKRPSKVEGEGHAALEEAVTEQDELMETGKPRQKRQASTGQKRTVRYVPFYATVLWRAIHSV